MSKGRAARMHWVQVVASIIVALPCMPAPCQRPNVADEVLALEDPGAITAVLSIDSVAVVPEIGRAVRARDYAGAERLLIDKISEHPEPELLSSLGHIFFLDGKYLNAAIAFKKAEELSPLDRSSRFNLAMSYLALKKNDWARPEIEKLVSEAPRKPLYHYWLGRLDYDSQDFETAIERFREVLEIDPGFTRAHNAIGLCYDALTNYEQAGHYYESAVRLNRQQATPSPWPSLNYGTMLLKLGKLREAEELLRESVGWDDGLARSHYRLGTLLEKRELYEEAIRELFRAAELDSSYPEPLYALGRVYRRTGNLTGAKQALEAFRKLKEEER